MVDTNNKNLTPRQTRALQSLISGATVMDAAAEAGVSRQTLYKWLDSSNFQQALSEAQSRALNSLAGALIALGDKAIKVLDETMERFGQDSVRVRAADIVINRLLQFRELTDLEARISALEAAKHD